MDIEIHKETFSTRFTYEIKKKNPYSMTQIIIPERFLNYLYHAFKPITNPDHHRVKIILRDGRKLRNVQVWNGCVLLIEKGIKFNTNEIEIMQTDFDFMPVQVKK